MAGLKSVSQAALLVLGIALIVMVQSGEAQFCITQLNNLNVCGQFVVPGANSRPSTECCSALRSVDHDCFCDTLRIASCLPSLCDIPPVSCGTESEELRILVRKRCILLTGSCRNDEECRGICSSIGVRGFCSQCMKSNNVCCCCRNTISSFNQLVAQT